jgi:hypothetical protein
MIKYRGWVVFINQEMLMTVEEYEKLLQVGGAIPKEQKEKFKRRFTVCKPSIEEISKEISNE